MIKQSSRKLRIANNYVHRIIPKPHMRCSASQMFADNGFMNFEALIRKLTNTFINRLTVSGIAIVSALHDNMVSRDSSLKY